MLGGHAHVCMWRSMRPLCNDDTTKRPAGMVGEKQPPSLWGEPSRQRELHIQRSWGTSAPGVCEEQQEAEENRGEQEEVRAEGREGPTSQPW